MPDSITPPPELINQWRLDWEALRPQGIPCQFEYVAIRASQRGADMELEACCEWVTMETLESGVHLRAARRPKPPSLKEQALQALAAIEGDFNTVGDRAATIRRALEAMNDD